MNFYLTRHAQTYESKRSVDYGDNILTAKIIKEGIPAIERMSRFLKNIDTDINICSELKRCRQTSKIISGITDKKFIFDSRINEYLDKYEGETFLHLRQRIESFLSDLKTKNYKNILVVTHGAIIAGIKNLLLNRKFEEKDIVDYPDCGELVIVKDERLEIFDFK